VLDALGLERAERSQDRSRLAIVHAVSMAPHDAILGRSEAPDRDAESAPGLCRRIDASTQLLAKALEAEDGANPETTTHAGDRERVAETQRPGLEHPHQDRPMMAMSPRVFQDLVYAFDPQARHSSESNIWERSTYVPVCGRSNAV
jgi:hypothetical protein